MSKDGTARMRQSAASRLLSGNSVSSKTYCSCAGDYSRTAGKPPSAKPKHVCTVPGELEDDASTSHSRQASTGSSTCAGSASSWPPRELSNDSQASRIFWSGQCNDKAQQHVHEAQQLLAGFL
jgi:hypothetical protein